MTQISKKFLHERDAQIYSARATGASPTELAKKFEISVGTVNTAIRRHLEQLNRTAVIAYPEVMAMELDRLDKLQRAIWPLTQHRRVVLDNDEEITLEPDMKAIDMVVRIMGQRQKLMGLDVTQIDLRTQGGQQPEVVSSLKGAKRLEGEIETPEDEARKIIELSMKSGILDEATGLALLESGKIIDAEIVEDDDE